MLPGLFTQPRLRYFSFLLLAGAIAVVAYWCFPSLRLMTHAGKSVRFQERNGSMLHRLRPGVVRCRQSGRIDILHALL